MFGVGRGDFDDVQDVEGLPMGFAPKIAPQLPVFVD